MRVMSVGRKIYLGMVLLCFLLIQGMQLQAQQDGQQNGQDVRIKDIAVIQGIRDNQLIGFGMVTGLSGRGDSNRSTLVKQVLSNLLTSFGVAVSEQDIQSRNTALVMLTATLPPFSQPGDKIHLTVSSVQDATSLEGGVLLLTPLQAANGQIYAAAQGNISLFEGDRSPRTVGIVQHGAIVERGVSADFLRDGKVSVVLRNPDFSTISNVAEVLEQEFPDLSFEINDAARIQIEIPDGYRNNPIGFIAAVERLRVVPDYRAKVVINQKSGVVVSGKNVRIGTVAVAFRGAEIQVRPPSRRADNGNIVLLDELATVNDFVTVMQRAGMNTETIIEVLRAVERAGALYGILEVM